MHKDIQADEIGLNFLIVPKDRHRESVPPKSRPDTKGDIQNDNPDLYALQSAAWKSLTDLSISPFLNKGQYATISKSRIVKGMRALNGYRSYWLLVDGEVQKSVSALTDDEARELLK